MALIALDALLGLFGRSLLSRTTAGNQAGPLWVEYEFFARYQAPSSLRVYIRPPIGSDRTVRIHLKEPYIRNIQMERIMPEPEIAEARPDGLSYSFRTAPSDQPALVTFHRKPQKIAILSGEIASEESEPINFQQFVYP